MHGGLAHASWIDLVIVAVSVGAVFAAGLWKRAGEYSDYLIAGRRLSLPAFAMSLITSWYGGILGVSEYSYSYGLSNWFVFGVPYYLYALIFALILAKKARRSELMSLPDRFESAYGKGAARVCGGIIFLTTMPAAYLLMLGKLIEWMFGWPYHVSLLVGTAVSTLYLFRGGLASVVNTDKIQFVFMYVGFAVMVAMLYQHHGGLEFIRANVSSDLLTPTGGQAIGAVLVWYVIASTTLVEPLFYERAFAARSEKFVLPGIVIAILFWAVFDFMTTATGLYARAILGSIDSPVFAFPELAARVLPVGLFGLFLAALVAVVASTIDSYTFIAGAALGRDVLGRNQSQNKLKLLKVGGALGLLTALALAWFSDSVIELWYSIGSITAPALLFPALLAWFSKSPPKANIATTAMLLAGGTALLWRLSSFWSATGDYWLGVEPIFVGLAVSVLVLTPDLLLKR
ncbi:MAG: sodium:solute symporter family protein [Calditrichaeota bacterium]|nr:sodium:solute symporter family protein [Calditrichota bacterium]MCB9367854.1 sodium:solute symporter family protein [Calditrichota bacterium]